MPKISVVIPVYNKAKYIQATVNSVLQQTFKDFELIIIDDGSTDNSAEIINSFDDNRIKFITQKNNGVANARNKGVQIAQTELICFLDADDLWYDNHLEEIWHLSTSFPAAAFYATAYQIQHHGHIKKYVYPFEQQRQLIDKFYQYDKGIALFYISNFAVKKSIFIQESGFKSQIHAEDTDFFLRLSLKYPMAYSKEVTMLHINEAENSLFANYNIDKKVAITKSFIKQEQNDPYLKRYLDMNRFAWSIEYLLNNQNQKAKQLQQEIDFKNLNIKQKILLHLPSWLLIY